MRIFISINSSKYTIYTDGACLGNPGPGGWAAIILYEKSGLKTQKVGSNISTTNNRMEITAIIEALKTIPKNANIEVFTDSKYVINGIENWIHGWKRNNWVNSNNKKVKNKDLWLILDDLCSFYKIKWNWVKGHSGNINNEIVDNLARTQALKSTSN